MPSVNTPAQTLKIQTQQLDIEQTRLATLQSQKAQLALTGQDTTAIDAQIAQQNQDVIDQQADVANAQQAVGNSQDLTALPTTEIQPAPVAGVDITQPETVAPGESSTSSYANNNDYNYQDGPDANAGVNDGPAGDSNPDLTSASGSQDPVDPSDSFGDPSAARRANLNPGGENSTAASRGTSVIPGTTSFGGLSADSDWRVRISLPPGSQNLYKDPEGAGLMQPLINSGLFGVVFPYTPAITVSHNARYQEQGLTHSNFKSYFYEGSDVAAITVSGEWTVQNIREGEYLMAAIYFLRACTKMFWGSAIDAGAPPTLVYLDGYGQFYFPHVSCIVTNFTHTMPNDVDYLELTGSPFANGTRVPLMSTISVTLQPVVSRARQTTFNTNYYSKGWLTGSKFGTGGFL